jgi:hypothetical protein
VMTVRGRKLWWIVGGLVAVGLLMFGLSRFLAGQHLAKADQWASVISMFLALAGLVVAGYTVVQDHRRAPSPSSESVDGTVRNTVAGAQVAGPALLGRDMKRVSLTSTPVPASADPAGTCEPGPDAAGSGDVENRVEGGTFQCSLILGRDLRDITLPPPPPSPGRQDGDGTGQ